MAKETFCIDYPKTPAGKKQWSKEFGTNAYWAGKHHAKRAKDSKFWHALTQAAMHKAGVRKKPFEKPVKITFFWNDRLDLDNHSMMAKMIVDGMKPRLILDDTRRYVKEIAFLWHDEPNIKVVVKEVE